MHDTDFVRFKDLMAMTAMITVLWEMMPCSPVDLYRRLEGPRCRHL
jgi:hypothetical protein